MRRIHSEGQGLRVHLNCVSYLRSELSGEPGNVLRMIRRDSSYVLIHFMDPSWCVKGTVTVYRLDWGLV